jgi:hypothetical protein
MVSVFLIFVAVVSLFWGALAFYETSATGAALTRDELFVALLYWAICAVCLGSAAVLDCIKTATRKMCKKLDEIAG